MDLGTIKKKLQLNVYGDASEFIDDMELVFYNCRIYNGTTSEVGAIGIQCNQEFERVLNSYGVRERFCTERMDNTHNETVNNNVNVEVSNNVNTEQNIYEEERNGENDNVYVEEEDRDSGAVGLDNSGEKGEDAMDIEEDDE